MKDKSKVREGEKRGAMHSISSLNYSVPKKTPIAFHNRSNYDYNFIMKELAKEFSFLEESTEKYITFTVSIAKEVQ